MSEQNDMPAWLERMPRWLFIALLIGIVAGLGVSIWQFGFMMTLAYLILLLTLWGTVALWFHEMGFSGNALIGPFLALMVSALGTIFVHSVYTPFASLPCDAGEALVVGNRYEKVLDRGRIHKRATNLRAHLQCVNAAGEAQPVGLAFTFGLPAVIFYLIHLACAGVGQRIAAKTAVRGGVSFLIALGISILFILLP